VRRKTEVFSAKTGTGASTVVKRNQLVKVGQQPVMAKMTLSYGGTPTITIALQGSRDGGVTWEDIVEGTYTTGSPKYLHARLATQPRVRYHQWRLNISANTNVTVDKGYIGIGQVED